MHLFEALSNYSPLYIPDGQQRRERAPEPGVVQQLTHPNRKLSQDEIVQLAERYQAGASILGLGRTYGMHEQTVRAHLKRQGIELRPKYALTKEQVETATELYSAGNSLQAVADQLDTSYSTLRVTLLRAGVRMRPRHTSSRS